jgi:prepilin peptidase CpaA
VTPLFFVRFGRRTDSMHTIAFWSNLGVLALAACIDIWVRRVPNWLTVPFLLSGLAVQVLMGGWTGARTSLGGIAVATLLFGIPCFLGGMGMGDLKLAIGIGAWIGPWQLFLAFIVTSIVGGILAVGYALRRGHLGESLSRTGSLLAGDTTAKHQTGPSIPYVPAIAIGTVFSFFAH